MFVAADEVHSSAMSVMDGNREVDEAAEGVGAVGREGGASPQAESPVRPVDNIQVAVEGEHPIATLHCTQATVVRFGEPSICSSVVKECRLCVSKHMEPLFKGTRRPNVLKVNP